MLAAGAHAATDVTGFGLLGHGGSMARASGVRFVFDSPAVPFMPSVLDLADAGLRARGYATQRGNARGVFTDFAPIRSRGAADRALRRADVGRVADRLVREAVPELTRRLREYGAHAAVIGEVREGAGVEVR